MKTCFVVLYRLKDGSVMSADWALGHVCESESHAKQAIECEKKCDVKKFGSECFEYKYEEKAVL